MQIPLLNGVYVDSSPAVRVSYPVNLVPVPTQSGVSDWSLRPAEGIEAFTTGQGADRGAIVWEGTHYRVSGTKLISISSAGVVTVIGTIPGTGQVRMDFSFDHLGIAADGDLYLYDGAALLAVTDPDAGNVLDVQWIDGYWAVTDGIFVAVSDLADPFSYSPLKYGSTDTPDPIKTIRKVQNELHVVSRDLIDVFQNEGGTGFPFARVPSALISKGAVGRDAACVFGDALAFLGGGRNEALGIYLGRNAQVIKISTRSIDELLLEYTEDQLSEAVLETVIDRGSQFLYVHLTDRTIVYDATATASVPSDKPAAERPVWFTLTSAINGFSQYLARNIVRVDDRWVVGSPASSAIGRWSTETSKHYGVTVRWEFGTAMLRNEGRGAIINQLELVALTGAVAEGLDPTVSTSHSLDGISWSQDRTVRVGKRGDTTKRLVWFQQGHWRGTRIQRFRGDSNSRLTALSVEAQISPLAY